MSRAQNNNVVLFRKSSRIYCAGTLLISYSFYDVL
jgi:hypothetical protein